MIAIALMTPFAASAASAASRSVAPCRCCTAFARSTADFVDFQSSIPSGNGIDKFAIATGLVDNTVEALYFLDFLTGDMRAAVINPKNGKFTAFFLPSGLRVGNSFSARSTR